MLCNIIYNAKNKNAGTSRVSLNHIYSYFRVQSPHLLFYDCIEFRLTQMRKGLEKSKKKHIMEFPRIGTGNV